MTSVSVPPATLANPYIVKIASKAELKGIKRWLKREWDDFYLRNRTHEGFYDNFMHEQGDVWVCKVDGTRTVLGFLTGTMGKHPYMNIMQVRTKHRKCGVGRALVNFFLDEVKKHDPLGIEIQCEPCTSAPFWTRMGFVDVMPGMHSLSHHYKCWCFHGSTELPPEAQKVTVAVSLSEYSGKPSQTEFTTIAANINGAFVLKEHFVAYSDHYDTEMKVVIDGREVFNGKAKYSAPIGGERERNFIRLRRVVLPC